MFASDVMNFLAKDYPRVLALKTPSTGSPASKGFDALLSNYCVLATYQPTAKDDNVIGKTLYETENKLNGINEKLELFT